VPWEGGNDSPAVSSYLRFDQAEILRGMTLPTSRLNRGKGVEPVTPKCSLNGAVFDRYSSLVPLMLWAEAEPTVGGLCLPALCLSARSVESESLDRLRERLDLVAAAVADNDLEGKLTR